jgi:hypothetical protein
MRSETDNPKKFIFYNFLAGIARGLGFAFGVTFIFALIIWFLSKLSLVPLLGDWINSILKYIESTRVY